MQDDAKDFSLNRMLHFSLVKTAIAGNPYLFPLFYRPKSRFRHLPGTIAIPALLDVTAPTLQRSSAGIRGLGGVARTLPSLHKMN